MAGQHKSGEFELIARYFAPLARGAEGAFGLTDDAAVVRPSEGHELVLTKDTIVAGVHFLPEDPLDLVAQKLVRVNLSDLAAKGAAPKGYLLSLAWPENLTDEDIALFAQGLRKDQDIFGIHLLGGDTVTTPGPATFSLTAIGEVPCGTMLKRRGAAPGEGIFVTGTLGEGALGLMAARDEIPVSLSERRELVRHYRLPQPRVAAGMSLRGTASAALDISDGLTGDLMHLCRASGVRARIAQSALPLSGTVRRLVGAEPALWRCVLSGGDDYEIVFTAGDAASADLSRLAREAGIPFTRIGYVEEGTPALLMEDLNGKTGALTPDSYTHS